MYFKYFLLLIICLYFSKENANNYKSYDKNNTLEIYDWPLKDPNTDLIPLPNGSLSGIGTVSSRRLATDNELKTNGCSRYGNDISDMYYVKGSNLIFKNGSTNILEGTDLIAIFTYNNSLNAIDSTGEVIHQLNCVQDNCPIAQNKV